MTKQSKQIVHDALCELGQYADLKLQGYMMDNLPYEHAMVQTAIRMKTLANTALNELNKANR